MLRLMQILRDRCGATAIEYAVVASLISVAAIAGFHALGNNLKSTYNNVSNNVQ